MVCTQNKWLTDREYLHEFNTKLQRHRIPVNGSIDLTYACNLKCVHCYVDRNVGAVPRRAPELAPEAWFSIIDQMTDAGCLSLLITGGEPFLHPHFAEIYLYAKRKGLIITIFTNATLVDQQLLSLFSDYAPHVIEVSLYGATAETYESISRVPGSFERCIGGTTSLIDAGFNVRLKTVLMQPNKHEFSEMEHLARELGVRFRSDPILFPTLQGGLGPVSLRVDPAEVVQRELADQDRLDRYRDVYEKMLDLSISDKLYNCGAGQTCFHIDPFGTLQPCIMSRDCTFSLNEGTFAHGWNNVIAAVRELKLPRDVPCRGCDRIALCGMCPPLLYNSPDNNSLDYLCSLGHYRLQTIMQKTGELLCSINQT